MNQAPAAAIFFDPRRWDHRLVLERDQFRAHAGADWIEPDPAIVRAFVPPHTSQVRPRSGGAQSIALSAMSALSIPLAYNLGLFLAAPDPSSREQAWNVLVREVATAGAIGAGTGALKELIMGTLRRLKASLIKAVAPGSSVLQAISRIMDGLGAGLSFGGAAASMMITAATSLVQSLGHLLLSCYRWLSGNPEDARMERQLAWEALSPQQLLSNAGFVAASQSANFLAMKLALAAGATGPLGVAITVTLYTLGQALAWWGYNSVHLTGGIIPWAKRWLGYERKLHWVVTTPEDFSPEELRCPITQSMIVDPVRFRLSGQLYNRPDVLEWVRARGTDPMTRADACVKDYIHAPVAKRAIDEVAVVLRMHLEPIIV